MEQTKNKLRNMREQLISQIKSQKSDTCNILGLIRVYRVITNRVRSIIPQIAIKVNLNEKP